MNEWRNTWGTATFPLTNFLLNRRGVLSRYDELRRSEWYQPERLRELQLRKLKLLIAYAYEQVPFYTERFRAIGMLPGDIRSLEDLRKVPPLSRQEVIDRRKDLVDRRLIDSLAVADGSSRGPGEPIPFAPFRRHKLVRNTSSGSTGAPTVSYEDGSQTAINWVHELRLKSWFGNLTGAREARIVASNDVWSVGFQPMLKPSPAYEAMFPQSRAEFRRRDFELETHTEVTVSPEDDVELRRISITNYSRFRRTIELTSYAEVVLASAAADATHPAFSNLFVQTEIIRNRQAILCTRRPRSHQEHPPWMLHLMSVHGTSAGTTILTDTVLQGNQACGGSALYSWNSLTRLAGVRVEANTHLGDPGYCQNAVIMA